VYQLKERKRFVRGIHLPQMAFDQAQAFEQAKQVPEYRADDLADFRTFDLTHNAIDLTPATGGIRRSQTYQRVPVGRSIYGKRSRRP
jgi:hypothetical protein